MLTDLSSVLSQCTRLTERQTDRRTAFSSLDRVCIACSAVKSYIEADLEFWRLESWSRDVSRPVFTNLGLGLGLGTSESWSWSWSWNPRVWSWSWNLRILVLVLVLKPSSLGLGLGLGTCDHEDSVFVTHEA